MLLTCQVQICMLVFCRAGGAVKASSPSPISPFSSGCCSVIHPRSSPVFSPFSSGSFSCSMKVCLRLFQCLAYRKCANVEGMHLLKADKLCVFFYDFLSFASKILERSMFILSTVSPFCSSLHSAFRLLSYHSIKTVL